MRLTVEFSPFIESLLCLENPCVIFALPIHKFFFIFFFCSHLVKGFYSCTLSLDLYYSGLFLLFNEQIELEIVCLILPIVNDFWANYFRTGGKNCVNESYFFSFWKLCRREILFPWKKNIYRGDIIGVDQHKFHDN